jgi:DNA modification methylase
VESSIFFVKESKKICPHPDKSLDDVAAKRLEWILETFSGSIPPSFKESWADVKLYNPRGAVDEAFGLILDPEAGAYDVRNSLNDLTGKEWVKFTSSWFLFNAIPADIKQEKAISPDFASHPATFSPTMIENFIEFFTKEGMTVLDPFSGIGSTVAAAIRTRRYGIGIELNPKYAELSRLRFSAGEALVINGNSLNLDTYNLPEIDFSISSPPYWDVLNRSTKDFKKNRETKELDVAYSDSDEDLGNIDDYERFLDLTTELYSKVFDCLKPGSYNVVIIKNVKKNGKFYPLAWDLAKRMSLKWDLKDEKIWIQDQVSLAPYGYPRAWASNIIHHYCLIFQKPKK